MTYYHGWLLLNKPRGISSNQAVQKIRKLLGKENKVGHAGTLDPLAQGVLPIAIGEATKTVQYIMNEEKEYEFTITWGEETTTADAEGEITLSGGRTPSLAEIEQILPQFIGDLTQTPPAFSAIKLNGVPAYKLARQGAEVSIPRREIKIKSLKVIDHSDNTCSFRVECSKGTYIRSLAVDIARALGTYGYVSFLNRTRIGDFLLKDTIMLANLVELVHNGEAIWQLLPVNHGLGDILAVEVNAEQAKALRNGLPIFLDNFGDLPSVIQILCNGILQAIATSSGENYKPIRVFNL